MSFIGASAKFTVAGVTYTYNLNSSSGMAGIWTVQNVNPTFTQAKAGSAVDNEVQPFAEIAYSDWTGSVGLYERTTDPGDFTRPFISSLDHSKPRQLTGAPFGGAGMGAVVQVNVTGATFDTLGTNYGTVDSAAGPGFIAKKSGSATFGWWLWNETAPAWQFQRDVYNSPGNMTTGGTCRAVAGSMHRPFQTVVQYGTALYMATTGGTAGLTDISIAAAAPAGATAITGCVCAVKYFDQLVTFSLTGGNIVVQALAGSPLTITQSIGADGTLSNNTCKIYGETNLMGAVALGGNLHVFSDRSWYVLQWIEATNVFVVEPVLVGNGKFTSNPAVFQNELYIGSDNQLWHWTPGQSNQDFKQIDKDGWLPSPYNGRITQLVPFMQVMVAKVTNNAGAKGTEDDGVLLRYTSLGSWQYLSYTIAPISTNNTLTTTPVFRTQDGTNFPTIHMLQNTNSAYVSSVFESGQNVRTASAATAYALSGILVTPWEYGDNRTAQKQLLRSRFELESMAGNGSTAYYQIDNQNRLANSPDYTANYPGTTSLGTWKAATAATWTASTTGDAGSALDSTGSGVLWNEYDGSNVSDWHGNTAYPSFKRIRWLYLIAVSTAVAAPALLSHAWQRLEYAFKFYVINTVLKLEFHQDHPNNPTPTIDGATALMAELNRIQSWDYSKSIITVVGPDNVSYPCVITKFLSNITNIDPNGPCSATVALTLQCVKMFGLAI